LAESFYIFPDRLIERVTIAPPGREDWRTSVLKTENRHRDANDRAILALTRRS
jgi:hypothetical protein